MAVRLPKQLIHLGEEELRYIDGYLAQNCQPTKVKSRRRKLDWKELEKDVKQNPESRVFRQS